MFNQTGNYYEINPDTIAVMASEKNGRRISQVLEKNESFFVQQLPSKIMDRSCKFFGSSLKGRQEGVKEICGVTHKVPVSIDPSNGMYFFPTASPSNFDCSWISHSHIEKVNRAPEQCTEIIFKNGTTILLNVSYGSIMNQVRRTAQYRYLLDYRIKHLSKKNADIVAEPFN